MVHLNADDSAATEPNEPSYPRGAPVRKSAATRRLQAPGTDTGHAGFAIDEHDDGVVAVGRHDDR
jgi:hypothetical protein